MMSKLFSRLLTTGICSLLALEALHFFWLSWSIAALFHAARNVASADPLPQAVWTNALAGALLLAIAVAYFSNLWSVRRWFVIVAGISLVYGIWSFSQYYPIMFSWSGAFQGDLVAVETMSGVGFALLGALGLVARAQRNN